MLFGYAMNDIGDNAPYHEAVGLVDTDGRVGLVPGNEPAEGSAFVDLELLDGKLAIYEGYDEVAVGWFYLAVDDGKETDNIELRSEKMRNVIGKVPPRFMYLMETGIWIVYVRIPAYSLYKGSFSQP